MGKVIIIAEAGVNHNGHLNLAKQLIDVAAEAGADYIKFQTFVTDLIIDASAPKAEYQKSKEKTVESQYDMVKKLELSIEDFHQLRDYCHLKGIRFLTSVADFVSLERIGQFDLDFIKISSGEVTNSLFLKKIAGMNKPVLLSTGMAFLGEIETALNILTSGGVKREDITVLHCNTEYPTPMQDVNLKAMLSIREAFKTNIGYSDHTLGIEIPIAAVAMGAKVIEKHFTLDKNLPGPDHSSSLEPQELKSMVEAIRNVELALSGNGRKEPSQSESKNISIVRKSIFSKTNILEGEILTEDNIILKRPGDGIPANEIDKVLGKKENKTIQEGTKLSYNDILW